MTMGLMGSGRKELNGHIDPQILTKVVDVMGSDSMKENMLEKSPIDAQNDGKHPSLQRHCMGQPLTYGPDEYASKPPTPPESRPSTPRVTIAECPVRLQPYSVPKNYGAVERNAIYRSGKPGKENLDFLESLDVKTMLYVSALLDESYLADPSKHSDRSFGR